MQPDNRKEQYKRWGIEVPSHDEHGFPEDIRELMQPALATKWWLEGNILCAETQHGVIRQRIPPNYICIGMDEKGLPKLQKIGTNKVTAADRGGKQIRGQ